MTASGKKPPASNPTIASALRTLDTEAEGITASASQTQVIIHDLSEEGLLVESPVPLAQ